MTDLPHADRARTRRRSPLRRYGLHVYRVGLFAVIILSVHLQHRWYIAQERGSRVKELTIEDARPFFPAGVSLGDFEPVHGGQIVLDGDGASLGYVIQTLPEAEEMVGFSGPTNMLIAFGADGRVIGMTILQSGDTKEHAGDVARNERFMTALNGRTWREALQVQDVEAVSGATLTSQAIIEGIAVRLGGNRESSRFPQEITIAEANAFFPDANRLEADPRYEHLLRVVDAQGKLLGHVGRTSPFGDNMVGYQGPTDTLIAVDTEGRVVGAAIRHSYDNEPYVRYVREDEYFFNIFKGFLLDEVAQIDMVSAGIEGVSGATRTSIIVAEALIRAAGELTHEKPPPKPLIELDSRDYSTAAIVVLGLFIGLTHLRGKKWLRVVFQIAVVVYLGFVNADMVSQALVVGWAQNGPPWQIAPALVLLTAAAFAVPIFTGRQVYCAQLCPFGALQDGLRRVPVRAKLSRRVDRILRLIPAALLVFVVVVAMLHLPVSLVGIEPFDSFVIRVAGWATIGVAVVGLLAALFVPMAYCHYGCPTGALLNFVRINGASGRFTRRDLLATALALLALGLWLG